MFAYKLLRISLAQVGDEDMRLPYWLSNASALLCLLQKNMRSSGFLTGNSQRPAGSVGSAGLNGRVAHVSGLILTFIFSFCCEFYFLMRKTFHRVKQYYVGDRVLFS